MPRSPCSPQRKRLPKYKTLARDLPPNTHETLTRHRYQQNPRGENRPCRVVPDDAPGRTNCYNPKAHSTRRKTCQLLVDPDNPIHDFEPGLYLVPGPRFHDETLVCSAVDIIMVESEDVDTRRRPPSQPIVVLGPYPHPVTGLLVVKCILLSTLHNASNINSFGQAFQTMDMSERGVMVPDVDMLDALASDIRQSDVDESERLLTNIASVQKSLNDQEKHLETLDDACERDPEFEKRVRVICKSFYEMALYFRRYAGPGRKIPLGLLQGVGTRSNPISPNLVGKAVTPTATGVRVATTRSGESDAADFVMDPEGTLTNMSEAHAQVVLTTYTKLTPRQQTLVTHAFQLGTPFRIVNGNGRFYLNNVDPNFYNGNPAHFSLNLFDMCYGGAHDHFHAHASVYGTRTYCVQIAAIQIIRCVQTILPYIYKSRPTWAHADGEFDNVHT